jgi:nucleoside-diphosphate-sugar epimerase
MIEVNGEGAYQIHPFPPERESIDIGGYYADYSKIQTQFGWNPKTPLRESIETTLSYYRSHISHYL